MLEFSSGMADNRNKTVFSILNRGGKAADAQPKALPYVLGLKFVARSRVERDEVEAIEALLRDSPTPDVVMDRAEIGNGDVSLWLHVADPKRAFKALSARPEIAQRLDSIQAAYADRKKLKFSILWPKNVRGPQGLG